MYQDSASWRQNRATCYSRATYTNLRVHGNFKLISRRADDLSRIRARSAGPLLSSVKNMSEDLLDPHCVQEFSLHSLKYLVNVWRDAAWKSVFVGKGNKLKNGLTAVAATATMVAAVGGHTTTTTTAGRQPREIACGFLSLTHNRSVIYCHFHLY